jgi:putative transposase
VKTVLGRMRDENARVDIARICRWLGVPRSTVYYEPRKRVPRPIDGFVANLIYEVIQMQPAWGVRKTWSYLRFELGFATLNVKKVARIMRREGWTVRQRRAGKRPRVEHRQSVATRPNERWATDIALVHCGRDGWCAFVPVIDCCTRQVVGWELAATAKAKTAERALENALLVRFGHCRAAPRTLVIRHDNGLVFGSRRYVATVTEYGLTQEYIAPYTPEQNGLCERFIRTLKEEFVWHRRFASIDEARREIAAWIRFYNGSRPHSRLGMKSPDAYHARACAIVPVAA